MDAIPGREAPGGGPEMERENDTGAFIGSIDCGTTSSRFLIFNREGTPVASHQIEFDNMYPKSGSVAIPLRSVYRRLIVESPDGMNITPKNWL